MSRVQLALRVADLEASIDFYSRLFGATPAKRRPGYANFAIAEPPLKLVLLEGEQGVPTVMDHLGVEVESSGQVREATSRLAGQGLATEAEEDTACCYALQDKVWVHGPGGEPWEVYASRPTPTCWRRTLTARAARPQETAAARMCRPAAERAAGARDAWAEGHALASAAADLPPALVTAPRLPRCRPRRHPGR